MSYPQLPSGKQRQHAYDECHVYRHWWQPTTVTIEGRYYVQHLVCQRCCMERRWRVHRTTGEPIKNSYTPPPGYYQKGDRQARRKLRIAEIERSRTTKKIRRVV